MKEIDLDINLVDRIKAGEKTALDEVYKRHKSVFIAWINKKYSQFSQERVEDIYQDVVIIFYQNIINNKLIKLRVPIKAYLFGIGDNYIKALIRKTKKEQKAKKEAWGTIIDPFVSDTYREDKEDLLVKLLNQMAEKCQKILRLFYYEDKKIDFITHALGFSNKQQTSREKHRCEARLRKAMFEALSKMD